MKLAEKIAPVWRNLDPQQHRRAGSIARFFAVLLVLTLVARGTSGATMPVVTVQTPSSGSVSQSVEATGTVGYTGGTPFTVPAGLLVTGVPVQQGQQVTAGDVLATFDKAELGRAIDAKRAQLQQLQTQAAQQAKGDTADPYAAQLAQQQLQRAYQDTQNTWADGQEEVDRARQKRSEAAQAVEAARNAPLDPALPGDQAEAQKQAEVEAATAALEAADEALYQTEKAAEAANEAALAAAQNVEDTRNTALHALEKEEEQVAEQNALDRAAAAVSEAEAAACQAELDALLALQRSGGSLLAPMSGTIIRLDLQPGQVSTAVGGLLAGGDSGYTLELKLDEGQAQHITVGTVLHVRQNKTEGDAAVQSLSAPDADGAVTAAATLPDGAWTAGSASVNATAQGVRQELIVPASAVRQDNSRIYVLALEEQNTLLGLQNVVVALPVTVLESGDTTAAVAGALDHTTQVVVGSNKAVAAGDRVRVNDAA